MKFETTEFHCCPAVSRNYGGKTKEIIIIIICHIHIWALLDYNIASLHHCSGPPWDTSGQYDTVGFKSEGPQIAATMLTIAQSL